MHNKHPTYSGLNQNPFIIPPIRAAQGVHLDELGGLGEMHGPQVSYVPSVSRALLLIMVHAYESTFNHEAYFKLLMLVKPSHTVEPTV